MAPDKAFGDPEIANITLSAAFDAMVADVNAQGDAARKLLLELFYYCQEEDLLALLRTVSRMKDADKLIFQHLAKRLADGQAMQGERRAGRVPAPAPAASSPASTPMEGPP